MDLSAHQARIQPLPPLWCPGVVMAVLRLDELHPVVSGNKWFKLQPYIDAAKATAKSTLLTFGGPFSNHLVATAAAAKANCLKSVGLVRGEKSNGLSHTLRDAEEHGMELLFLSREEFRRADAPASVWEQHSREEVLTIPQGGYGAEGAAGAAHIIAGERYKEFTHFVTAVGTGTTVAGLALSTTDTQKVIGISALKNAFSLHEEINALLPVNHRDGFALLHDYSFGGYARQAKDLFHFMNDFYTETGIRTDFVYTAKAFFAARKLGASGYFPPESKVLLLHTGGLQGNASLRKGTLIFG